MAIQLLPLVAGAAVGALVTYLYKDDNARKSIKKNLGVASDKLSEGVDSVKTAISRKGKASATAAKATGKKTSRKKVAKKKTTKKRSAKKKVAKKKIAKKKMESKKDAPSS